MGTFPIFLSVVYVVRNQEPILAKTISDAAQKIAPLVADYEFIILDNASTDNSVSVLKELTQADGLPNLQVYALTKQVDNDIATWAGLENALGDYVAVLDPQVDDVSILSSMLDLATDGTDVVYAHNTQKKKQNLTYRAAHSTFNLLYRYLNGEKLLSDTPNYRVIAKQVINFILQHPKPEITFRHLPSAAGFTRKYIQYSANPGPREKKSVYDGIDRGIRLLVSTTQAPMRLVTFLSLFGAAANLIYSAYVIGIGLFKHDVAEGWVSLSLQQSGMFFLLSLVLLVLGEYILHMTSLSNESPRYHVSQEFNSETVTRKKKLNIEDASALSGIAPSNDERKK